MGLVSRRLRPEGSGADLTLQSTPFNFLGSEYSRLVDPGKAGFTLAAEDEVELVLWILKVRSHFNQNTVIIFAFFFFFFSMFPKMRALEC